MAGGELRRQTPVLVIAVCAVGVLFASRLGPAAPQELDMARLLLVPDALARYLHILAFPPAASIFHALDRLGAGWGWGALPALLAVGGLLALAPPRTRRVAGTLLLACAVLYLPNVAVRFGVSPVSDRYLYDPLAALAWLVATARIPVPQLRSAAALACVGVVILLGFSGLGRQKVWATPVALWADAAAKYPDHPFVWLQLGVAREGAGDGEGASAAYRAHLERRPESAAGLNNLARALARQGRAGEALPLLDRALELDPDVGPIWFNRGEVLLALGLRAEALRTFREAVELQPELAEAHNVIGVLMLEEGRIPEARAALQAAIEARPDRPNAHYNLGRLLAREGHIEDAERHYKEAVRLRPGYKRAHNNLALVYLRTGRTQEAIAALERALEIDPTFEEARVNLGNAHFRVAVEEWGAVVRQNPERRRVAEQLEQLRAAGLLQQRERKNARDELGDADSEPR
jgi:tetratricopeptide (TPR) repeat protein